MSEKLHINKSHAQNLIESVATGAGREVLKSLQVESRATFTSVLFQYDPQTATHSCRRNAPDGEVLQGDLINFVITDDLKLFILDVLAECMNGENEEFSRPVGHGTNAMPSISFDNTW